MQPGARPRLSHSNGERLDLNATSTSANRRPRRRHDVARVLAGDVQAFEGIVRRWQGPLVNMAWRYCRDRGRAEEMAQEAFLRAWRGLASMASRIQLLHLALRPRRQCLPLRTQAFPHRSLSARSKLPNRPHRLASTSHSLTGKGHEVLRRAVLALPLRYREPVILFYFHEMDLSAAARTMGLPEGTLKARLSRARALLKNRFPHLNQQSGDPAIASLNTGKQASR